MRQKIEKYVKTWKACGYPRDIPDEVPNVLMQLRLAPSFKAIATAILKNDHAMQSLGFAADQTRWYTELKRIEISMRPNAGPNQLDFWR